MQAERPHTRDELAGLLWLDFPDETARCRSCAQRREQAVALYRGDFLAHFFLADSQPFEEWLLLQRESLRRLVMPALYHLATFYEESGRLELAQQCAARQLELDPWREEAHRQLMRALAAGGQRSAALAQYQTCRRLLAQELGASPTKVTRSMQMNSCRQWQRWPALAIDIYTTS